MSTVTNEQNWPPSLPTEQGTMQTEQRCLRDLRRMDRSGSPMAGPDAVLRRSRRADQRRRQQQRPASCQSFAVQQTSVLRREERATADTAAAACTGRVRGLGRSPAACGGSPQGVAADLFYGVFSTGGIVFFHGRLGESVENQALSERAAAGDYLGSLEALRDMLAHSIESCESKRDLAALSRQFVAVSAEIRGERASEAGSHEDDTLNELRRRRQERQATTGVYWSTDRTHR